MIAFSTAIATLLVLSGARLLYLLRLAVNQYREDLALGQKHGCQLPPELPKRWPLGIDRIKELWDSNAEGRLLAFLCSIAKDYEPRNNLYQFLLVGPRAFHVLHPRNVETLLSTNFKDYGFGARPSVFAPLLGKGIFTQEGTEWKHSRELLRKQFVRAQYQNLDHFREHVDNLVACIANNDVADLQPLFFNLTLDTTTALLFGQSVYSLRGAIDQKDENRGFAEAFTTAQEGLAKLPTRTTPFSVQSTIIPEGLPKGASIRRQIYRRARDRAAKPSRRPIVLVPRSSGCGFKLEGRSSRPAPQCSVSRPRYNCLLLIMDLSTTCTSSGDDGTTAPRDKLSHGRFAIRDEGEYQKDSLFVMPLRLYPPVPLNNREAIETTILPTGGGPDGDSPILVRKGELVVISQYVNSRKKNLYGQDADDFRPERWETGEMDKIGWAYFKTYGIQEIYRPTDREADVDIVAVHGLNGDATRTWTARKRNVSWLSHPDFLPGYIENARVLVWGYNSSFSTLTGVEPSMNRIHHHAQTLVAQLFADRRLEGRVDKPIIFICHSLGGLVVKRALAYSKSRSSDKIAHIQTIFTCTHSVMFFGTPHHGSSKASLLLTLQKLASIAVPKRAAKFEKVLVAALKEESETLQNITDFFVPLMKHFHIAFFWEQEKTDLKYTKDYIVEKESAAPNFDDTERAGIMADHSGMVKFEDASSPSFKMVIETMLRYCKDAPDVIRTRWTTSMQSLAQNRHEEEIEKMRRIRTLPYMPTLPLVTPAISIAGEKIGFKAQDSFKARELSQE
ncbi:putative Cytochrome P450 [Seiridium cardinale]